MRDGAKIYYEDHGRGETLLFSHGGKISVRSQSSEIPERTDVVFAVQF